MLSNVVRLDDAHNIKPFRIVQKPIIDCFFVIRCSLFTQQGSLDGKTKADYHTSFIYKTLKLYADLKEREEKMFIP